MRNSQDADLTSFAGIRDTLIARLRLQQDDLQHTIGAAIRRLDRTPCIRDTTECTVQHATAIAAALQYCINAIEQGGAWEPIPDALAEQARCAARIGISQGAMVRHYFAAHACFMDCVRQEIAYTSHHEHQAILDQLRDAYRPLVDHIITSLEYHYDAEKARIRISPQQSLDVIVRKVLTEDVAATTRAHLNYEIDACWHIGIVTPRTEARDLFERMPLARGRALLVARGNEQAVWAWYGSRDEMTVNELHKLVSAVDPIFPTIATGFPGYGLTGFRQSHEEAHLAASLIGVKSRAELITIADALPVASAAQSDTVVRMYHANYILPLNMLRKHGRSVRRSLLAYFKCGRNISSTAAMLKLTRRTIENHLTEARRVLAVPLNMTSLEIALRLEELGYMPTSEGAVPSTGRQQSQTSRPRSV